METGTPEGIGQKVRNALMGKRTKDVFIFLFFVLICSIFWFVRELEETFSTEVVVPVKLTDVPKGVIITTDVPKELKLTIHDKGVELIPLLLGKRLDTLSINFKNFDNREPTGRGILQLPQLQSSLKKLLPASASILTMSPDTVSFYFNRGIHRRLPVRVHGVVEAGPQYCISGKHFSPDSVDVYAPLSILDTMHAAYTERLDLKELNRSELHRVRVRTIHGMRVFPDTVTLSTEIDVLTRQTIEVPVVGVNFPADKTLRTFPSTVKVTYLVPGAQAKNIDPSEFAVIVSYAELLENETNRCRPHLNYVPDCVSSALVDPMEVDYLLETVNNGDADDADKKTQKKRTRK